MKIFIRLTLAATMAVLTGGSVVVAAPGVSITGQNPGATPFIRLVEATVAEPAALKSIRFTIAPKPGALALPIVATYSSDYLQRGGYLHLTNGQLTVPVFGLYLNYSNTVTLVAAFKGGKVSTNLTVVTPPGDPSLDPYTNPTAIVARAPEIKLSYSYILLKNFINNNTPIIVDTDGEVRWSGTTGASSQPAIFFENGLYIASGTTLARMELTGTATNLNDYAGLGVTGFHHNFDPGKHGFLMDVDTTNAIEATVIEVDADGQALKTWHLDEIVRDAMTAGGDDPSELVRAPDDWFHNNACTYDRFNNLLIASGREDFVLALDYDTGAIRWILGDPSKKWYQYASLRRFALQLTGTTHPPIGQHAVSIGKDRTLMLFDNGTSSLNQNPPGDSRDYSAARKYRIHSRSLTATEVWSYTNNPAISSPFCSSAYEDKARNYFIDYAMAGSATCELVGLDKKNQKAFHYSYPALAFCGTAWNAIPIHLEKLSFK